MLQYSIAANSISSNSRYQDLLKISEKKLLDIFTDYVKMINKSTHISESFIDHAYVRTNLRTFH